MDFRIASIPRFLYSHYFFGGVRQGVGMLLPVLIVGGLFGNYSLGLVATFGAQCLAIIDQPGGPQRHRTNEMLGGAVLATLTVMITGAASMHPFLLWLAIIGQSFFFSMFSVFGKRGGLIGFGGLLIMTLTMHSAIDPEQIWMHVGATLGGAMFYLAFSIAFSRLLWLREERQAMSVALFATADYMAARSRFYDEAEDLDESYRRLIRAQSVMTEKHQAARDIVLRALPRGRGYGDSERVMLWNMFVNMLQLLDTLVASHTDYASLRRALAGHDCLMFMRDALAKMSVEINRIAFDVSRGRATQYRSSVKAELRAIEYEVEQFKQQGMAEREPETLALIVQVLRRLRNASRIVNKLVEHTAARRDAQPTDEIRIDKSLTQFMSRQELRVGMLTSNLRLDSPYFRYAVRVALAAALAMAVIGGSDPASAAHSYWVLLTIVIIMKPGFALTRQRNGWRLMGTLIGCMLALVLFHFTTRPEVLFPVLLMACIMGNSLVQLNYMASAIFNTLFVVLVFHFVAPGTVSMAVIGERAIDTALGCAIALACSYVLPWWEARYMKPLARAATNANREYLRTGLRYARAMQAAAAGTAPTEDTPTPEQADIAWRLARKNVHIAFSNYAEAFYRMMSEPRSHQVNVPEFNNLLIQNHIMASQITAAVPLLATLDNTPESMRRALYGLVDMLDDQQPAPTDLPTQFDTTGELATLAYPLKQMIRAAQQIRQELAAVDDPPQTRPAVAAA
ncbi:FUSC family protein [Bordetella sp. 02P26C-1]|uniref:FUSC family protein n=1 Tax=Bordetella sp. 02P26C-1 TaxID=2683195 RepID=UPI0013548F5B|nr:FUSC family membrane protein [Bordetella sp. 02P26C-1]MVW77753.1 FUSC family protein [Bordetella sp. 02P26C-1]